LTELGGECFCAVAKKMFHGVDGSTLTDSWREARVAVDVPGLPNFVEDEALTAGPLTEVFIVELEHLSCKGVGGVPIEVAVGGLLQTLVDVSGEVLGFEDVVKLK
jgi:hypothetical protein